MSREPDSSSPRSSPGAGGEAPPMGGVLIGGASARMGSPKALLRWGNGTLLDAVADALGPLVREVVLLGEGRVPESREAMRAVPDAPGIRGPLGGILAALRCAPDAAWIVAGCDQPFVDARAVEWLVAQRRPGIVAVLPRLDGRVQPLLALYEPGARPFVEAMTARGESAPRRLADRPDVASPEVPPEIRRAWLSVNTPEEYERQRPAGS